MSFPKSKILSPTSLSQNGHNVKQETNVNINLNERSLTSAINSVANPSTTNADADITPSPSTEEIKPTESKTHNINEYKEQINQLNSCVNFLKQVVHLIQSNPLIVSAVVIATQQDLINLIPLLVDNCSNVEIKVDEDSMLTCCQASQYAKIDRILVTVDGEIKNLKYQFPDVYSTFQLYNISLKLVRMN